MHAEYIHEEKDYMKNTFELIHYPIYFILKANEKAFKTHNNNTNKTKMNNTERIILPTNSITKNLNNTLHASDIQIINNKSKTMNDIINKKVSKKTSPEAEIYSIRCARYFCFC